MIRNGLSLFSALLLFSPLSKAQAQYAAADAVDAQINEAVETGLIPGAVCLSAMTARSFITKPMAIVR